MSIAWFIFITIVIILFQSSLYKNFGLTNIEYKRYFNRKEVFQGEQIEMIDQIANKKLLPIPWLRLESKINSNLSFQKEDNERSNAEGDSFHRTLFSLLPYQKITRRHKVTCSKRGYYQLSTVSMSTGDAFGFGEFFRSISAHTAVTVYPQLIPVQDIPLPSHSWMGDLTVRRWIIDDPFIHAGVREYAYGDSMSSINWKATARTTSLQVSKKDYTADHNLMIYLNFDETEDIWLPIRDEQLFEKGLSYAASIAQYAISKGVNTGFGCNGYLVEPFGTTDKIKESVRIEPKNNNSQLSLIWDTMAKLAIGRSMNFHYFLQEDITQKTSNLDILIITQSVTENTQTNIRQIEAQGNSVNVIRLSNDDERFGDGQGTMGEGERYAN